MIHYHGGPITPADAAALIYSGRHAMVSFAEPRDLPLVADVCQSFALDNGAFSFWKAGKPTNWEAYYLWVRKWGLHPAFDWALIPDVIDGTEEQNNDLLRAWPFANHVGVPVWHLHESLERLQDLTAEYDRVALGSSGQFATVGNKPWWNRIAQAMGACCDESGRPYKKLHGLRMLNPEVFRRLPFASADSTNVARNVGMDTRWRGTYTPSTPGIRGIVLAQRIEAFQSSPTWHGAELQPELDVFMGVQQ